MDLYIFVRGVLCEMPNFVINFGQLDVYSKFHFISPSRNDNFQEDLSFTPDVILIFFSMRDLQDAWVDQHEILHDGQYWAQGPIL